MSNIQPLSGSQHKGLRWRRPTDYRFTASQNFAPLAQSELARAALSFPLVFVSHEGRWSLGAMLGLQPGQNLYLMPDGSWLPSYAPAQFRTHPFALGAGPEGDAALCLDVDSELVGQAGEPIFSDTGDLSPPVSEIWSLLQETLAGVAALQAASALLANAGVLEPWPLAVRTPEGERTVPGLFRVSETELNRLDGAEYVKLRDAGVLAVAYAQLLSMGNLADLEQLLQIHAQAASAGSATPAGDPTVDWTKVGH